MQFGLGGQIMARNDLLFKYQNASSAILTGESRNAFQRAPTSTTKAVLGGLKL